MGPDRCVCCGIIIPEGRQVCPLCDQQEIDEKYDIVTKAINSYSGYDRKENKTMKESMINKAKKFWAAHKYEIMGVLTLAGIGTYAYCKYRQSQPSDEEIDKAVTTALADSANTTEQTETEFDRRQKDPAYQLENGGWITDDYELGPFKSDDGKEINCVEMIINDLPIGNLGVFADDISKKLDKMYPNHGPLTDVSMVVDLRSDPTFEGESHQDIRKEESAA